MLSPKVKPKWRRMALVLSAVLVLLAAAACGQKNKEGGASGAGEVIATYKDGQVTAEEFDKYLSVFTVLYPGYEQIVNIPEFREELVKQYIAYKILNTRASDEVKKQAASQVDEQYAFFEQQVESSPEQKKALDEADVSGEDVKTFMTLMMNAVEEMNSKVTEDDMKAEFEKRKSDFELVTVRHILVQTVNPQTQEEVRSKEEALKRAQEAKKKLEEGGDWDAIAKEYSDDPGSKDKGGLYEKQPAGGWVEGFKKASLEQELNVIGEPVETEFGYHVIKVEARESRNYDQLNEEEKTRIKGELAYNLMNEFMTKELPGLIEKIEPMKEEKSGDNGQKSDAGSQSQDKGEAEQGADGDKADGNGAQEGGASSGAAQNKNEASQNK
ncbi:peptidylprolyl isomerase [Paenibacillus cisolokensis]|uniref:PpiC domain-containing protein n=1 Tax=Paenibacillus cisolokensis TaxID=1658519 RepID=A0ABQ4NAC0_9BACL|nr:MULTISPECIES: peptidylprolyl isomerase [Paenibacillus]ALS25747.1 PpiC-type peptidyl-prolyl cis-trans isomerase [Paenibacillus sp. 32O-W]GIQ65151.1 hypothetical protein PACILC2_37190 [Paenibacillus cisolokensis]